jgi:nitroreductase
MDDAIETIMSRASVRAFKDEAIAPELWEKLLRAAMAAPSAMNCQPWEFIVVRKREVLEALSAALPYAKMAAQAGGALVACALPGKAFQGSEALALIDASLACENFLLAASALGLGAVWTALHPHPDRELSARRILGIPNDVIPLAFIPIGYPAESPAVKDKYKPALVHWELW